MSHCLGRVLSVLAETILQEQVEHATALSGKRLYLLWHTLWSGTGADPVLTVSLHVKAISDKILLCVEFSVPPFGSSLAGGKDSFKWFHYVCTIETSRELWSRNSGAKEVFRTLWLQHPFQKQMSIAESHHQQLLTSHKYLLLPPLCSVCVPQICAPYMEPSSQGNILAKLPFSKDVASIIKWCQRFKLQEILSQFHILLRKQYPPPTTPLSLSAFSFFSY